MLFNSLGFAAFLPLVFVLYWFVTRKNHAAQNLLLLAASYFFYACWDYRFLGLLVFSTLLDFFSAKKIITQKTRAGRRRWLALSIIVNLGVLFFFKYYNFFIESFAGLFSGMGIRLNPWTLQVILPIGISFYTFHGLSYIIDIYRGKINVEKNLVDYGVFVSFFPLLVAGPIERAQHLLPQIKQQRHFDPGKAADGLRQILWGLFKKMVIADWCGVYVDIIFNNYGDYHGSTLVAGAVLFAFQIYGDFSGYSDIAIGTAKLFGIELYRNFAFPYFSRDIAEFWRRWHISLSTWFRDYVYIPLGGSRGNTWKKIRNTFIIFLLSGFWHGANWTFIAWGLLNAVYFLPLLMMKRHRDHLDIVAQGRMLPRPMELVQVLVTFGLVTFGWIFFRSPSIADAIAFSGAIFQPSFLPGPGFIPALLILFIAFFLVLEWFGREQPYALAGFGLRWPRFYRWTFYYAIIFFIILFGGPERKFIYFQF